MNPRRRNRRRTQKSCEAYLAKHYANAPRGTRRCLDQAQWIVHHIAGTGLAGLMHVGFAAFPQGPALR